MIDINIIRNNRNLVEENIKKKFQDEKLPLVGEILSIDERVRKLKIEGDNLRKERNTISSEIGLLMRDKKKEEAEDKKKLVLDKKKSKELSNLTFEEILNQKISMRTK